MGTNYYAVANECGHCGRRDLIHIGKQSGGWPFCFRGYRDDSDPIKISSRKEWEQYLSGPGVGITDEYGAPQTLAEMQSLWEETGLKPNPHPDPDTTLDEDGYRFYFGEFS